MMDRGKGNDLTAIPLLFKHRISHNDKDYKEILIMALQIEKKQYRQQEQISRVDTGRDEGTEKSLTLTGGHRPHIFLTVLLMGWPVVSVRARARPACRRS